MDILNDIMMQIIHEHHAVSMIKKETLIFHKRFFFIHANIL